MVRGRTVSTVAWVIYLIIAFSIIEYAYFYWEMNAGNWFALVTLILGGAEMLNYFLTMIKQPRVRVVDSKVVVCNEGSELESKDLYLGIQNCGGKEALGCEVRVRVNEIWKEFRTLCNETEFNIKSGDKPLFIPFLTITKEYPMRIVIKIEGKLESFALTKEINQVEIFFVGENFERTKVYRLKLDVSSYENIRIKLDC